MTANENRTESKFMKLMRITRWMEDKLSEKVDFPKLAKRAFKNDGWVYDNQAHMESDPESSPSYGELEQSQLSSESM